MCQFRSILDGFRAPAPKLSEMGQFGSILDDFRAPAPTFSEISRFGSILDGFRAPAPKWFGMDRFGTIFDGVRAPAPKWSEMGQFGAILDGFRAPAYYFPQWCFSNYAHLRNNPPVQFLLICSSIYPVLIETGKWEQFVPASVSNWLDWAYLGNF